MNKKIIYILLIITVLAGCKKVDIDVPVDTPVFFMNATLDGITPIDLNAGDDDFYMFTEFTKDNLEVYTLTGRLAKDTNCTTDCEESLTFSIRGNAVTPSINDFDISQALPLNSNLSFIGMEGLDTTMVNTYSFEGNLLDTSNPNPIVSYTWTLSNGFISTGQTFTYVDSAFSEFDLDVEMIDGSGCVATFSQSNISNMNNCNLGISVTGNVNNGFSVTPQYSGLNSSIIWNGSPNQNDSMISLSDSIYINDDLFLEIGNPNQPNECSFGVKMCLELLLDSINNEFFVNNVKVPEVSYTVQPDLIINTIPNDEQFSHVNIEYQDATGVLYSSFNGNNFNNTFTITKVEDFEDNENGEKTKKLTIDYNATLFDTQGNFKEIVGSGVIGVAYPD